MIPNRKLLPAGAARAAPAPADHTSDCCRHFGKGESPRDDNLRPAFLTTDSSPTARSFQHVFGFAVCRISRRVIEPIRVGGSLGVRGVLCIPFTHLTPGFLRSLPGLARTTFMTGAGRFLAHRSAPHKSPLLRRSSRPRAAPFLHR